MIMYIYKNPQSSLVAQWLKIWCCHFCGSGHCCGSGYISDPGILYAVDVAKKKKNPVLNILLYTLYILLYNNLILKGYSQYGKR